MSPAHDIRNALTPLTLSEDPEVAAAAWRVVELLPALEVDAAAHDGTRAALQQALGRVEALEQALEGARANLRALSQAGALAAGGGSLLGGAEAPTNASAPGLPLCHRCEDKGFVMHGRGQADPEQRDEPCGWCRVCEACDGAGRVAHDADQPKGLRCSKCAGTGAQAEQRRFCSEACGDVAEAGRASCAECSRGVSESLGGF